MSTAYPKYGAVPTSNLTISGAGTNTVSISGASTGTTWSTGAKTIAQGKLHLEGADADVVMNGVSLKDTLNSINNRLAILQPNPKLLEKYEALQQAYEHYLTLEALLHDEENAK